MLRLCHGLLYVILCIEYLGYSPFLGAWADPRPRDSNYMPLQTLRFVLCVMPR